jgi:transcriptional regulator with XRE-family HTH domain
MTVPVPVTVAFGRRVRELRQERGWSLRYLAPLVSLDPATLSKIENGSGTTLGAAGRIADAFGLRLAAFLPPVRCAYCLDSPPRGFICPVCGTTGPEVTG